MAPGRGGGSVALLATVAAVGAIVAATCAAIAGGTLADPAPARPERPGEPWAEVTLCSRRGPVRFEMPGPVQFDGPRPLRNIEGPANGTFAISYSPSGARRYDAFVLDEVEGEGSDAEAVLSTVLPALDGEPGAVELGSIEAVGDHVEVAYVERFNDRQIYAHAFGFDDMVVVVDVAIQDGSPVREAEIARDDLAYLRTAVVLPDPTGARGCDGAKQVSIST